MKSVIQTAVWQAQEGPQAALIACPVEEIFFGGARGGGKTEGSIGDWLEHSNTYGEHATGVFFRRKQRQLDEVIARTKQIFTPLGAKYREQKSEWIMPRGARLKFRYLERDSDAEEYQGHNYTRVYVEEVTNFPTPGPINKLRATLRSPTGVPSGIRLTGNPGGPGHHWVKQRYITPAPKGWKVLTEKFEIQPGKYVEAKRIFIPSKITDNRLVMENDPMYVVRLHQSGSKALVEAWLTGNWDLVDGAFFDCWNEPLHVRPRVSISGIPSHIEMFRGLDWGSAKPFSVGWWAVGDGKWQPPGACELPEGALFKVAEWYGSDGRPNVGLKLDARIVARGIVERENNWNRRVAWGVADPSIWVKDGGPSIFEMMIGVGTSWRRADNKRIPGWNQMRGRLVGTGGVPDLFFSEDCEDSIRCIPVAQHDENNAEDLDSDNEDHAIDECRYACMSRPRTRFAKVDAGIQYPKNPNELTINELIARKKAARIRAESEA